MCIPSHDFFPTNKDTTIFRALVCGKKLYEDEIGRSPQLSEESGQNHDKHGSDDNEDEMLIYEFLVA